MKKIENRFGVIVELRPLGFSVVSARVVLPGNICLYDARRLSSSVMENLVVDPSIVVHSLDDGSFILCRAVDASASRELTLASCVSRELRSVCFPIVLSLEDGDEHDVTIDLVHCSDERYDYLLNHCRVVDLRGTISLEIDDENNQAL